MKFKFSIKAYYIVFFLYIFSNNISAQIVDFESSNLPIILINTNGNTIVDEPKITAHMSIINHENGDRNYVTDTPNEYDGYIGIELRGNSSQNWAKKPYGLETRDEFGENNNVPLFNMPAENDWIIYAPYVDKTLMRNVLMYGLGSEIGGYAPRTQFFELILNDEYMGVYVFIEKIKKDKGRVNISKSSADNITGGYLLEMIQNNQLKNDEVHFKLEQSGKEIVVKYPKPDSISPEQLEYISSYLNNFEHALNSDSFTDETDGYAKYIDIPSFIDQMLLSEAFNQLDAFCHSVYLYKDQDAKLHLGPGWDYNRSMGNAKYYNSWRTDIWLMKETYSTNPDSWYRINWGKRFMKDSVYMNDFADRWFELRNTIFTLDHIYGLIDENVSLLEESRERNFERWNVLGVNFNNKYVFDTYDEEITYMKEWIDLKFTWLDEQFNTTDNYPLTATSLTYSSQEEENPAENAVDGNNYTRWSAEFFPQWIELDLGEVKNINKTIVVPYMERAYQYVVEAKEAVTDDYMLVVDRSTNTNGGVQFVDEFNSVAAQYVKLTVSGANNYDGDWCSISEFMVYENIVLNSEKYIEINNLSILKQNYPNPFNSSTTIEYTVANEGLVSLKVYNMLGLEVDQLVYEVKATGSYKTTFNAENLAAGMYLYKLNINGYSEVNRMLFIK